MLLDVVDGVANGSDLLSVLVGDLDIECLLELHDQLNGIERIGTQVVNYSLLDRGALFRDTGFQCHADFKSSILRTAQWLRAQKEGKK